MTEIRLARARCAWPFAQEAHADALKSLRAQLAAEFAKEKADWMVEQRRCVFAAVVPSMSFFLYSKRVQECSTYTCKGVLVQCWHVLGGGGGDCE